MELIDKLANGETLEPKHNDHALSGNLQGTRECHIKPDLLLIYEKFDDILQLNALRKVKFIKFTTLQNTHESRILPNPTQIFPRYSLLSFSLLLHR